MCKIREGYIPFKGLQTWYRIVEGGDTEKAPLILLHGGPGSSHNSLEVLDDIADTGRTLVFYDQIGCGHSPAPDERTDLFTKEVWCEELANLRQHLGLTRVHLLGHSWGGMLAITYLSDCHPQGVLSAVLSSTLPSSSLWAKEAHRLIAKLPAWAQEAIAKAERDGDWSDPEFQRANTLYMNQHVGGPWPDDAPEPIRRPRIGGRVAYETAWGPSEFNPLGNLKDWEYLDKMKTWDLPVLITDGADDESTPYISLQMHKAVKGSQFEIFEFSRHMSYYEQHDEYVALVTSFLDSWDR